MAGPAYFDAFRRIVVQPDNITISADAVDDTLTLVAGAGISLVANANSDQITIVNTNSGQFSLAVAGDDSTLRTINSGETIRFAGTGGVTVTSNAEGAITINGPNLAAVSQNIIPTADVTYDIGSSTNRFRDIYLSGSTIYLGSTTVGVTSAGQLVVSEEYTGGEGIGGIASVEWTNASEIEIRTEDDSPYIDKLESLKIGDTFTFLTGSSGTFPPNTIVTVSGAVTKTNIVSGFFDFVIPVLQSPVSNVFVYTFTITRKPITDISQLSNDSGYLTSWSFNVAGDDSTLRTIDKGETIKFIGASNVTVTTDAEGNITITGPNLSSYLTSIPNDVTIGGVRINTNRIQSVDSNADLELDASGTGAVSVLGNLKVSGNISINNSGGIGYTTGVGGTVTQTSNRGNGVTLNKITGEITLVSDSIPIGGINAFLCNNNLIESTDVVYAQVSSYNPGVYLVVPQAVTSPAPGIFFYLRNIDSFASPTEVVKIRYVIIKSTNT